MNTPVKIKFKKLNPKLGETLPAPQYATAGAAGIDLVASLAEPLVVEPQTTVMIPTGLAVDIPSPNIVGLLFARSGLSLKHGLVLANAVGVIDSDYKGEVMCAIQNNGDKNYQVQPGDRIAQLVFLPVIQVTMEYVDELTPSQRGEAGFGSTGR